MSIKNTPNAQHLNVQRGFRQIIGVSGGGMPDKGINSTPIRSTWEGVPIAEGSRLPFNGLNQALGTGTQYMTGVLTVADNNFATGPAIFQIGDVEFVSGVDYAIGALAANTATNIAAAINDKGLQAKGWRAVAVASDVTITYPHPGRIRFKVRHHGTKTNFTVSPTTGEMTYGDIQPGPPTLT